MIFGKISKKIKMLNPDVLINYQNPFLSSCILDLSFIKVINNLDSIKNIIY